MERLIKEQLSHNSQIENLKNKNDELLKFKGMPGIREYKKFLSRIKPGTVKNRTGKVPKRKKFNKKFYRSKSSKKFNKKQNRFRNARENKVL